MPAEEDVVLQITPWERVALQLLANGETTDDIAARFDMSDVEVEVHLSKLFARMGVRNRIEASAAAFRRGLVTSPSMPKEGGFTRSRNALRLLNACQPD